VYVCERVCVCVCERAHLHLQRWLSGFIIASPAADGLQKTISCVLIKEAGSFVLLVITLAVAVQKLMVYSHSSQHVLIPAILCVIS